MKELAKPVTLEESSQATFFYTECSGTGQICLVHDGGEKCCSGGVANKGCSGGASNDSMSDDIDILF